MKLLIRESLKMKKNKSVKNASMTYSYRWKQMPGTLYRCSCKNGTIGIWKKQKRRGVETTFSTSENFSTIKNFSLKLQINIKVITLKNKLFLN